MACLIHLIGGTVACKDPIDLLTEFQFAKVFIHVKMMVASSFVVLYWFRFAEPSVDKPHQMQNVSCGWNGHRLGGRGQCVCGELHVQGLCVGTTGLVWVVRTSRRVCAAKGVRFDIGQNQCGDLTPAILAYIILYRSFSMTAEGWHDRPQFTEYTLCPRPKYAS